MPYMRETLRTRLKWTERLRSCMAWYRGMGIYSGSFSEIMSYQEMLRKAQSASRESYSEQLAFENALRESLRGSPSTEFGHAVPSRAQGPSRSSREREDRELLEALSRSRLTHSGTVQKKPIKPKSFAREQEEEEDADLQKAIWESISALASGNGCSLTVDGVGRVNLRAIPNSGSGHCQYESIAQALPHLIPGGYQEVRRRIARAIEADVGGEIVGDDELLVHVENEEDNYRTLPKGNAAQLRKRIADHVRAGMWGDHLTLTYAAELWGTCFVTIRKDQGCKGLRVNDCSGQSENTVALLYDLDRHYELLAFNIPGRGEARSLRRWDDPVHALIVQGLVPLPRFEDPVPDKPAQQSWSAWLRSFYSGGAHPSSRRRTARRNTGRKRGGSRPRKTARRKTGRRKTTRRKTTRRKDANKSRG
jgi:hypothetical protein